MHECICRTKSWKWIGKVYEVVVLLDIFKFSSKEMVQFFTPIRPVKESLFPQGVRHSMSSSFWMFANQISKKWYLGVVLFYISLRTVVGLNIFSEYLKRLCKYSKLCVHIKLYVYFFSCELVVQLSVCLFYCIFQRPILNVIIFASFSVFQFINFYFIFIYLLHFSAYHVAVKDA